MSPFVGLETERLLLRPPQASDAPRIQQLANDRDVASKLTLMPYPYTLEDANEWLRLVDMETEAESDYTFAIVLKAENAFIGAMSIGNNQHNLRGELGYWVGKPYWGQGYTTEAARRVVRFGFETLGLHRVYATHYVNNPASGRVMQKLGMRYEGTLRGHLMKWGEPVDLAYYGILRTDEEASRL